MPSDFEDFTRAAAARPASGARPEPAAPGRVAVLGGGADGRLLAALSLSAGCSVTLFSAYGAELEFLRASSGIGLRGAGPVGTYHVDRADGPSVQLTAELDAAVQGAEVIFLTGPIHKQRTYAMVLADGRRPWALWRRFYRASCQQNRCWPQALPICPARLKSRRWLWAGPALARAARRCPWAARLCPKTAPLIPFWAQSNAACLAFWPKSGAASRGLSACATCRKQSRGYGPPRDGCPDPGRPLMDADLQSIAAARRMAETAFDAYRAFLGTDPAHVDAIVDAMARAIEPEAERLGAMAVEETGYGNVADKRVKNLFNALSVADYLREITTLGMLWRDDATKIAAFGEPMGVVAALVPVTNPTSTIIYKVLSAVKAGNAIVCAPHPRGVRCGMETVAIMARVAEQMGAPKGLIQCMDQVTSKSFDYGTACVSEQAVVADPEIARDLRAELKLKGAYFCTPAEKSSIRCWPSTPPKARITGSSWPIPLPSSKAGATRR